ncbi:hypothetical protein BJ138DRAFT_1120558 [Hygrophoropsis aurantiaca]|uniref:Uncharacterized protein n=1 Tax=Hygrophoropsis aurantiaca TaxID=72124 RepID=A0ACB7ZQB2_9AGAM|nr:hypothetical protein BJ138DRAFT_1120558 [Hygrophoropsis aurantiaca]
MTFQHLGLHLDNGQTAGASSGGLSCQDGTGRPHQSQASGPSQPPQSTQQLVQQPAQQPAQQPTQPPAQQPARQPAHHPVVQPARPDINPPVPPQAQPPAPHLAQPPVQPPDAPVPPANELAALRARIAELKRADTLLQQPAVDHCAIVQPLIADVATVDQVCLAFAPPKDEAKRPVLPPLQTGHKANALSIRKCHFSASCSLYCAPKILAKGQISPVLGTPAKG